MKTIYKIVIIFAFIILLILLAISIFMHFMHSYVSHYETLGNNEHWYYHPAGYKVECKKRMFDTPGECLAIDEYGVVVATKTKLGNWQNVTVRPDLVRDCDIKEWQASEYPCMPLDGITNWTGTVEDIVKVCTYDDSSQDGTCVIID